MMFTVYDFINRDIEAKQMKFGWKVEAGKNGKIVLKYTMLNFDWKSLDFLNCEQWNMFLQSEPYMKLKQKLDKAMLKHKRLYFDACSISHLKMMTAEYKLKIDIDRLVSKTVMKMAEKTKEKNEERDKHCIQ